MILSSIGSIGHHRTSMMHLLSSIGSIDHHQTSMRRLRPIGSI
ncbi:hypothetical protein FWK35_00007567, partial [Aphis craccivora]